VRRFRHALVLALFFATLTCGCDRPAAPPASSPSSVATALALQDFVRHPIVDDRERSLPALRIVSLSPTATEICCALGLRDALVGRTRYCEYPPEVASVPAVGTLLDVQAETLLELRPDLVLYSGTSRAQLDRIAPLKLRTESLPDRSLADVFTAIRRVGELCNRPRTASALCDSVERDIRRIATIVKITGSPRVLLTIEMLEDPPRAPHVAGAGSFYDDLLKRAGCKNAVESSGSFAPLALETIARLDPDVIIEIAADAHARPAGDADALRAWQRLGPLKAVRERRVRVLPGGELFLPGPRVAFVFERLCRAIAEGAP
jgi:iron complex transport system substrate-binding protein